MLKKIEWKPMNFLFASDYEENTIFIFKTVSGFITINTVKEKTWCGWEEDVPNEKIKYYAILD